MHFEKNKKKGTGSKGFYLALGICLIAIGVAAFTTYNNLFGVVESNKSTTSKIQAEQPKNNTESQTNNKPETSQSSMTSQSSENYNNKSDRQETEQTAVAVAKEEENDNQDENNQNQEQQQTNEPGLCIYPASKTVTKDFSANELAYSVTMNDWRIHNGTDFAAEKGSIVKAITDGTVKEINDDQTLGKTIVISHNGGFQAYYCGLGETTLVNPGDQVTTGQEIGSVKSVPCEVLEQDHLHLCIKKDGAFINPLDILEQAEQ